MSYQMIIRLILQAGGYAILEDLIRRLVIELQEWTLETDNEIDDRLIQLLRAAVHERGEECLTQRDETSLAQPKE